MLEKSIELTLKKGRLPLEFSIEQIPPQRELPLGLTIKLITEWLRPHRVVANYSGLYEEGEVEHINVYGLVF